MPYAKLVDFWSQLLQNVLPNEYINKTKQTHTLLVNLTSYALLNGPKYSTQKTEHFKITFSQLKSERTVSRAHISNIELHLRL